MKKLILSLSILSLFISSLHSSPFLVGERYVWAGGNLERPGDKLDREIDEMVVGLNLGGNLPVHENFDLYARFNYSAFRGTASVDVNTDIKIEHDVMNIGAGLSYHFLPNQKINPAINLLSEWYFVNGEYKYNGSTYYLSDSDSFALTPSLEVNIEVIEWLLLKPYINYTWFANYDDSDDYSVGLDTIFRISDALFISIGSNYSIEFEDISGQMVIGVKF